MDFWMAVGGMLVAFGVGGLAVLLWVARTVLIKPW